MRLIDADELKDDGCNYVWAETIGFGIAKKEYRFVNRIQIDNAPTVEAIPIEWIKETIKLAESVQSSKYAEHLRILLEDWREENEID